MNKIILIIFIKKFFLKFFYGCFTIVFYCFGIILNLFEEIEFLKILM